MFIGIIKARILEILDFVICGRSIAFRLASAFRLQKQSPRDQPTPPPKQKFRHPLETSTQKIPRGARQSLQFGANERDHDRATPHQSQQDLA
jgi:hypothetical protein